MPKSNGENHARHEEEPKAKKPTIRKDTKVIYVMRHVKKMKW